MFLSVSAVDYNVIDQMCRTNKFSIVDWATKEALLQFNVILV